MSFSRPKLIVILGPTAVGKSELAVEVARRFNGEVISADSRQVYRGLDIGSGKITKREMKGVPHHLLDVASPRRQFSVVQWHRLAQHAIADIIKRGKTPVICGGTGFYIQSIVHGTVFPEVPPNAALRKKFAGKGVDELFMTLTRIDARRAKEIDAKNSVRLIRAIEIATSLGSVPKIESHPRYDDILRIGITLPQGVLREKIAVRLRKRMWRGMVTEAQRLHKAGLSWKRMRELGLEYRALADLLSGRTNRTEMESKLTTDITHYAKRQMTWFKRDNRILWFAPSERASICKAVENFLIA